MNKNIFLNKHNQQNIRFNHKPSTNSTPEQPINNKYNPDVITNYTSKNNSLKLTDIEYTNQIWKGITGDEFTNNIKDANDLKIEFEKPNINDIISKHNNELSNRMKDKEMIDEKNRLIKQAALQNVMQLNIINDIKPVNETKMHDELKHIQIKENDILKEEKEKYNLLLRGLEDL
jgi:hypothetical protein